MGDSRDLSIAQIRIGASGFSGFAARSDKRDCARSIRSNSFPTRELHLHHATWLAVVPPLRASSQRVHEHVHRSLYWQNQQVQRSDTGDGVAAWGFIVRARARSCSVRIVAS